MDQTVIMNLPEGYRQLTRLLVESDWLHHFFNATEEQVYSPANYQHNIHFSNITYTLLIDSNIYIYLRSAFQKPPQENFRKAIGLLYFCINSGIQIDPFLPVMEEISFCSDMLETSIHNLDIFYAIDNYPDLESLLQYSLGIRDKLYLDESRIIASKGGEQIRDWHSKYHLLEKWDLFYITCLKIAIIDQLPVNNEMKFRQFVLWEKKDFLFSPICMAYAMVCFSNNRMQGTIKYKKKQGMIERRKAINNMVWDLYFVNHFIKRFSEKDDNQEFLLASADKALNRTSELAKCICFKAKPEELKKILNTEEFYYWQIYNQVYEDETISRNFVKDKIKQPELHKQMVAEYEDILGIREVL